MESLTFKYYWKLLFAIEHVLVITPNTQEVSIFLKSLKFNLQ